ncbi:transmembrane protein 70 homolog, mitochondrial [Belonocnema kinseyi]|uniref:transmembrane protein 70 homolog, mitochondrial n=1 Tax=Belonocnema kinseyi TaxID=2817044 RepID=UPI00143DF258|nr:transmembrane protein 70 homolog, mitochondrial [Belonocnema kinseyi]
MALLLKTWFNNQGRRCFMEVSHSKCTCVLNTKYLSNRIKITTYFRERYFSTKQDETISPATEVYTGILTRQIRNIKLFSLCTSCMGVMAQPIIYEKMAQTNSLGTLVGISVFFGLFTIATPLLLHMITKKYITSIKYLPEEDKYVATTYTIFLRDKQIEFQPKDVFVPEVPGMFTSCLIKKAPLFFTPDSFNDLSHYKRIMGYDKPIDFKLGIPEDVVPQKVNETSK